MSRLGFHPDLLSKSRAVPRPLGAASAPLLSVFGSRDAVLAHPPQMCIFFVMHISNGPLGAQCQERKGYLGHAFLLPLGLCTRQMRRECQPMCPCFLHFPRMASCPEKSDGQS